MPEIPTTDAARKTPRQDRIDDIGILLRLVAILLIRPESESGFSARRRSHWPWNIMAWADIPIGNLFLKFNSRRFLRSTFGIVNRESHLFPFRARAEYEGRGGCCRSLLS